VLIICYYYYYIYLLLLLYYHIISTDEDLSLLIESFAVINLRGVSTNKKYYRYKMFKNWKDI
jgi:hypothetical protein